MIAREGDAMNRQRYSGVLIENDTRLKNKYKKHISPHFDIKVFDFFELALPYILASVNTTSFCMFRILLSDIRDVINFLEKLHSINPFIKVIFIESTTLIDTRYAGFIEKYNAISITNIDDGSNIVNTIESAVMNTEDYKRKYTRTNWPLSARIYFHKNKDKKLIEKNILSISANGAFIEDNDNIPLKDDMIDITILFKDFKLFTKATVVWINDGIIKKEYSKGYAITFIDITTVSQRVLDSMIQDEILKNILL